MSNKLTIVARIEAEAAKADFVKAELLKLVGPTREEPGCIQYDLHQDNESPGLFLFYENWTTRELWQRHMSSTHLAAFKEATDGALISMSINEMTPL